MKDYIDSSINLVYKELIDDEKAIAATFNAFDKGIEEQEKIMATGLCDLDSSVSQAFDIILENEEISASAMNNLNERIEALETKIEAILQHLNIQ